MTTTNIRFYMFAILTLIAVLTLIEYNDVSEPMKCLQLFELN